jgi:hypothetical protein
MFAQANALVHGRDHDQTLLPIFKRLQTPKRLTEIPAMASDFALSNVSNAFKDIYI